MVKYAQDLSRKLMDSVKQPVAEAEIKQKMMAVSRPFNELKKKLGMMKLLCHSRPDHIMPKLFLVWLCDLFTLIKAPFQNYK